MKGNTYSNHFKDVLFPIPGFNPVWNEVFEFRVKVPELVLLRFTIFDSDLGSDDFLAQFCAPLHCLKQGRLSHCIFFVYNIN